MEAHAKAILHEIRQIEHLILVLLLFVATEEETKYIKDIFSALKASNDPLWSFIQDTDLKPLDMYPVVIVHWYAPYLTVLPTHSLPHALPELDSLIPDYKENDPIKCL